MSREQIEEQLIADLESALDWYRSAGPSEKDQAASALSRALDRHNQFVFYGIMPDGIRVQ